jgi:hypothetical protein
MYLYLFVLCDEVAVGKPIFASAKRFTCFRRPLGSGDQNRRLNRCQFSESCLVSDLNAPDNAYASGWVLARAAVCPTAFLGRLRELRMVLW